jgi:hypothetical protein
VLTSERGGERVTVVCATTGGMAGGSSEWYLLRNGYFAWAPAAYVEVRGGPVERC